MSDLLIVLKNSNELGAELTPVAVPTNVPVREILPEIVSHFKLLTRNSSSQYLYYGLRRNKSSRLMRETTNILDNEVVKGDLIMVEPTIPLSEILQDLQPVSFNSESIVSDFETRFGQVVILLPIFKQVADILERDAAEGYYYQLVTPSNVLFKVHLSENELVIYVGHREEADYRQSFEEVNIEKLSVGQILDRTKRIAFLSPQQRSTGYTVMDALFMTNNVYSLGVMVFLTLLGQMPPVIQTTDKVELLSQRVAEQFKLLGMPLVSILLKALHPETVGRYQQPSRFINDFSENLQDWMAQRKLFQEGNLKAKDFAQYEQALDYFKRIKPIYQQAWDLIPRIAQLEKDIQIRDLYIEANRKHQVGQFEAELETLRRLSQIHQEPDLANRISNLHYQVNYSQALELIQSGKKANLLRARELLSQLPGDYKDVQSQLNRLN